MPAIKPYPMQTVRVRSSKGPDGTRARTATNSTRNQEYWELPRSEGLVEEDRCKKS